MVSIQTAFLERRTTFVSWSYMATYLDQVSAAGSSILLFVVLVRDLISQTLFVFVGVIAIDEVYLCFALIAMRIAFVATEKAPPTANLADR